MIQSPLFHALLLQPHGPVKHLEQDEINMDYPEGPDGVTQSFKVEEEVRRSKSWKASIWLCGLEDEGAM